MHDNRFVYFPSPAPAELLQEFKQSLITEAVTGQRKFS